jgi:hypothetical protein
MKTRLKRTFWFLILLAMFSAPPLASAYYDPGVQRWINRDPIAEKGGLNLYVFAQNNALNEVDAFGHGPYYCLCVVGVTDCVLRCACVSLTDPRKHDTRAMQLSLCSCAALLLASGGAPFGLPAWGP